MGKKIIHINRNVIQHNAKHGTKAPVCRVQIGNITTYGMEVEIHGPSIMVYRPDEPLKCGAKLWIETEAEITIKDQMPFSEVKKLQKND